MGIVLRKPQTHSCSGLTIVKRGIDEIGALTLQRIDNSGLTVKLNRPIQINREKNICKNVV